MSTLKVQRQENTGVVYADPADLDLSVRFRHSQSQKVIGGVPVQNHVTEIIFNDGNSVTVAGVNTKDAVSVRLRVSGASESAARIKEILVAMAAQVDEWSDESVFQGFNPTTAPVIPAV